MTTEAYAIGALYIALSVLFVPVYLRIIYVFLRNRKYRSAKCFQIMIQIGLVQCTMGLSFVLQGISVLLGDDPIGIASVAVEVLSSCFRIETGLNFVLALDRFVIVCDVKCPPFALNALSLLVWLYGLIQFGFFSSPLASLRFSPSKFIAIYDYSLLYSKILEQTGLYYSWVLSFLTLLVYVVIVLYLLHQQTRLISVSANFRQKMILIQALIRFVSGAAITVLFHIIPRLLSPSIWITVGIITGYELNHLLLPVLLYVVCNGFVLESELQWSSVRFRSLRKEFFGKEAQSDTVKVQSITPVNATRQ